MCLHAKHTFNFLLQNATPLLREGQKSFQRLQLRVDRLVELRPFDVLTRTFALAMNFSVLSRSFSAKTKQETNFLTKYYSTHQPAK